MPICPGGRSCQQKVDNLDDQPERTAHERLERAHSVVVQSLASNTRGASKQLSVRSDQRVATGKSPGLLHIDGAAGGDEALIEQGSRLILISSSPESARPLPPHGEHGGLQAAFPEWRC